MNEPPGTSTLDRILTTHIGSLPRPPEVSGLIAAQVAGETVDPDKFRETVTAAVEETVQRQAAIGLDYVSDGEMGAPSFMDTRTRLTGFEGPMTPYMPEDVDGVLPFLADFGPVGDLLLASNTSKEITYRPERVTEAISRFKGVLAHHPGVVGGFFPSPSPGTLTRLGTSAFTSHEEFAFAIADALKQEYRLIASAGLILQIDAPDLVMSKHTDYQDSTVEEFRDVVRTHIRAINRAVEGIPAGQVRLHICWGNYPGPHHKDLPLEAVIDLIYEARVGMVLVEGANPQHRHEWSVFRDHPLPDGMVLGVGVVDTVSPIVEHPKTVSETLLRFADVVGKERVVATADCGFATFAGMPEAPLEVAYLKLAALVEGARLASAQLWG
jgi:5-methyltetrahydropteroyltriglutamate--homocysteine methyltransferase